MCHRPSKLSEIIVDGLPAATVPIRVPDESRPDLLDAVLAMSRPRRHALYSVLLAELSAIFRQPRERREQAIVDRIVADGEHTSPEPQQPSRRALERARAAQNVAVKATREERDLRLMKLFDEGTPTNVAAAEVGCSYAAANSVKLMWSGRRKLHERNEAESERAARRAGGVDDVPIPVKQFTLTELDDFIRRGNEAFGLAAEPALPEPKTIPTVERDPRRKSRK